MGPVMKPRPPWVRMGLLRFEGIQRKYFLGEKEGDQMERRACTRLHTRREASVAGAEGPASVSGVSLI